MNLFQGNESEPRLILGTVQLGMPYGIANTTGKPDTNAASEIVSRALALDIRYFDTAQAYGDSESVLGDVLAELGATNTTRITTKLDPASGPNDIARIEASIEASFQRLRVERLWCLMLHRPDWLAHWEQGLGGLLRRYRDAGRICHLGASLGTVRDAPAVLAHPDIEVVQAPCNAWDRRFAEQGFLEQARRAGKRCCIRSVYLQGLLAMTPSAAEAALPPAGEAARRWWDFAEKLGSPPRELAIRYALALRAPLVVGAETVEQLADTARMAALPPLDQDTICALAERLDPVLTEEILEPWRWTQR